MKKFLAIIFAIVLFSAFSSGVNAQELIINTPNPTLSAFIEEYLKDYIEKKQFKIKIKIGPIFDSSLFVDYFSHGILDGVVFASSHQLEKLKDYELLYPSDKNQPFNNIDDSFKSFYKGKVVWIALGWISKSAPEVEHLGGEDYVVRVVRGKKFHNVYGFGFNKSKAEKWPNIREIYDDLIAFLSSDKVMRILAEVFLIIPNLEYMEFNLKRKIDFILVDENGRPVRRKGRPVRTANPRPRMRGARDTTNYGVCGKSSACPIFKEMEETRIK